MTLRNEIFEGIAAYKALAPTPQDEYYNEALKEKRRQNAIDEKADKAREQAERTQPTGVTNTTLLPPPTTVASTQMPGTPVRAVPAVPPPAPIPAVQLGVVPGVPPINAVPTLPRYRDGGPVRDRDPLRDAVERNTNQQGLELIERDLDKPQLMRPSSDQYMREKGYPNRFNSVPRFQVGGPVGGAIDQYEAEVEQLVRDAVGAQPPPPELRSARPSGEGYAEPPAAVITGPPRPASRGPVPTPVRPSVVVPNPQPPAAPPMPPDANLGSLPPRDATDAEIIKNRIQQNLPGVPTIRQQQGYTDAPTVPLPAPPPEPVPAPAVAAPPGAPAVVTPPVVEPYPELGPGDGAINLNVVPGRPGARGARPAIPVPGVTPPTPATPPGVVPPPVGANGPQTSGSNTPGGSPGAGTKTPPAGSGSANTPSTAPKPTAVTTTPPPPPPAAAPAVPMAPGPGGVPVPKGSRQDQTRTEQMRPEEITEFLTAAAQNAPAPYANGANVPPPGTGAPSRPTFWNFVGANRRPGETDGQALMRGSLAAFKVYAAHGQVEKAGRMAWGLMQAANIEAAAMGKEAYQKLLSGDVNGAKQLVAKAGDLQMDGMNHSVSPDGRFLNVTNDKGELVKQVPLDGRHIVAMAMGLSDGTLMWGALQNAVDAWKGLTSKPDRNATGRALSDEIKRNQIKLQQQKLAGGGGKKGATTDPAVSDVQKLVAQMNRGEGDGSSPAVTHVTQNVDNTDAESTAIAADSGEYRDDD